MLHEPISIYDIMRKPNIMGCIMPLSCSIHMLGCVGATLACGTGACAVVVAAVLEGRAERVSLPLDFFYAF